MSGTGNTSINTAGITGTGGDLLKQGAGTLTLNTCSSYTGSSSGAWNVFLDRGTIEVGANNAIGTTNGTSTGWINIGASTTGQNGDGALCWR